MGNDDLGTLHAADRRMTLRFERRLEHPPDKVWRMVTDPDGLARWFPARVQYDAFEVGAKMTFTFGAADLQRAADAGVEEVPEVSTGSIREIDEPRVFEFDWLGEIIRLELHAEADGCRLVFTHEFDRDETQAPKNAAGWHVCLDNLLAALAGRVGPTPEWTETLHRRYATEMA
jgi:uncharacterized protein YndB with AHSA1/START domain